MSRFHLHVGYLEEMVFKYHVLDHILDCNKVYGYKTYESTYICSRGLAGFNRKQ